MKIQGLSLSSDIVKANKKPKKVMDGSIYWKTGGMQDGKEEYATPANPEISCRTTAGA